MYRSSFILWNRYRRGYQYYSSSSSSSSSDSNHTSSYWKFSFLSMLLSYNYSMDMIKDNENRTSSVKCDEFDDECGVKYDTDQSFTNWSSTHKCSPYRVYSPNSTQEVSRVLKLHHEKQQKIRPVGTALSPNGIGFVSSNLDSLISLSSMDHVNVDVERNLVSVGAGAKVDTILKELKKYGLTLSNFSSIQEQQIGGWTQVSAHGTGCSLSTVDDMIVKMVLAIPTGGILPLSRDNYPELFEMAKVGLGSLGVVTELTLKCMPQMQLEEETFVINRSKVMEGHNERLKKYRHVRYMWIPFTDTVVVVVSNPTKLEASSSSSSFKGSQLPTLPLVELLLQINNKFTKKEAEKLSFSQLRDLLLDYDPLNSKHVMKVNAAEAEFWKNSQGKRVDDSTNILGFDCGGEQWVMEVCFPIGSLDENSGKDVEFVNKLLDLIKKENIPAPSPIEQRWSARSTAKMSPASSIKDDEIFSWVGIIMYLPPNQNEEQRQAITQRFHEYCRVMRPLLNEYNGQIHWAKIELPKDEDSTIAMQKAIRKKYPVDEFNRLRRILDPNKILSNELITKLFD